MIRDEAIQSIQADAAEDDDRSMRIIEYAMALVALVVAGILALNR